MSSTTAGENSMLKVLAMVIGALVVFALLSVLLARLLSDEGSDQSDELMRNALIERIEPIGKIRTSPADTETTSAVERTNEELVQGACAACHIAGVADAPKLDDAEAWATRREAGLDALIASVIAGKNAMPPRGGSDYTDGEIRRAVEHIAGFTASDSEAAASDAGANAAPAAAATDESVAVEQSTTAEEPAAPEEPAAATASKEATASDAGTAVTAELTENIKAVVDGICSGCHIAGVAGAPKIGDKAEWDKRAAIGVDAMTQTVITGKGAMPPRGGTALTDEEMPAAIGYLMSK